MIEQREFRLPRTGEIWRTAGGEPVTVVGLATDQAGNVQVIYTPAGWGLGQLAPLAVVPIAEFVRVVKVPRSPQIGVPSRFKRLGAEPDEQHPPSTDFELVAAFKFWREAGSDDHCQYVPAGGLVFRVAAQLSAMAPTDKTFGMIFGLLKDAVASERRVLADREG